MPHVRYCLDSQIPPVSPDFGPTSIPQVAVTNGAGDYSITRVFCGDLESVTAHYAGAAEI